MTFNHIVFAAGELFYNYRISTGAARCLLELASALSVHYRVTIVGRAEFPKVDEYNAVTFTLATSDPEHERLLLGFLQNPSTIVIGAIDNAFVSIANALGNAVPAAGLIYWNHLAAHSFRDLPGLAACISRLDAVVTPTSFERRRLEKDILSLQGRIVVVPNGIRTPKNVESPSFQDGKQGSRIIFVGRRSKAKGYDLWLQACFQIARRIPAHFLTVGLEENAIDPALGGLRSKLLTAGLLAETTYLSPTKLHVEIGRSSLLVLPTRQDCFPICLLEAMHLGTPVVVNENANFREIAGDPPAFEFSGGGGAFDLAESCCKILRDDGARLKLIQTARERANVFSINECHDRMLDVLRTVSERSRCSA